MLGPRFVMEAPSRTSSLLLYAERRIARSPRVIFMRQRRAEQRHDTEPAFGQFLEQTRSFLAS